MRSHTGAQLNVCALILHCHAQASVGFNFMPPIPVVQAGDAAALAASMGTAVQDVPADVLHAQLLTEGAVLCHEC
jgi:hypothetical protein